VPGTACEAVTLEGSSDPPRDAVVGRGGASVGLAKILAVYGFPTTEGVGLMARRKGGGGGSLPTTSYE